MCVRFRQHSKAFEANTYTIRARIPLHISATSLHDNIHLKSAMSLHEALCRYMTLPTPTSCMHMCKFRLKG